MGVDGRGWSQSIILARACLMLQPFKTKYGFETGWAECRTIPSMNSVNYYQIFEQRSYTQSRTQTQSGWEGSASDRIPACRTPKAATQFAGSIHRAWTVSRIFPCRRSHSQDVRGREGRGLLDVSVKIQSPCSSLLTQLGRSWSVPTRISVISGPRSFVIPLGRWEIAVMFVECISRVAMCRGSGGNMERSRS